MSEIKVKTIKITVLDNDWELTIEQAKELRDKLNEVFEKEKPLYIPYERSPSIVSISGEIMRGPGSVIEY